MVFPWFSIVFPLISPSPHGFRAGLGHGIQSRRPGAIHRLRGADTAVHVAQLLVLGRVAEVAEDWGGTIYLYVCMYIYIYVDVCVYIDIDIDR